jgi:hypothetical protein
VSRIGVPGWLRSQLADNRREIEGVAETYATLRRRRSDLMVRAYALWVDPELPGAGLGVTDLADVTGLSRQAIYGVVGSQGSAEARAAARRERDGQLSI